MDGKILLRVAQKLPSLVELSGKRVGGFSIHPIGKIPDLMEVRGIPRAWANFSSFLKVDYYVHVQGLPVWFYRWIHAIGLFALCLSLEEY